MTDLHAAVSCSCGHDELDHSAPMVAGPCCIADCSCRAYGPPMTRAEAARMVAAVGGVLLLVALVVAGMIAGSAVLR